MPPTLGSFLLSAARPLSLRRFLGTAHSERLIQKPQTLEMKSVQKIKYLKIK